MKIRAQIEIIVDDPKALIEEWPPDDDEGTQQDDVEYALEQALDNTEIPGCCISASINRMEAVPD